MGSDGQTSWQVTLLVIAAPVVLRKFFAWWSSNASPSSSAWQGVGRDSLLRAFKPTSPFQPPPSPAGEGVQHSSWLSPSQLATIFVAGGIIGGNLVMMYLSTDLFIATKTHVTAPMIELRANVATKSYSELGWKQSWGEEGLEALMHKLASFDGRKTYLIHGAEPLLKCSFCISHADYGYYSLALRSTWFVLHAVLFGLLTMPGSTVRMLDSAFQKTAASPPQARPHWHRAGWRKTTMWTLASLAIMHVGVAQGYANVSGEQSYLNHWHRNLMLLESFTAVMLTAVLLFYPTLGPEQNIQHQIIRTQHAAYDSLQEVAASVQMTTLQKALTRRHPAWQEKVKAHWSRTASPHINEEVLKSTDAGAMPKISRAQMVAVPNSNGATAGAAGRMITEEEFARRTTQELEASAQKAGVDLSKERRQALAYAKLVWDGDEGIGAVGRKA